MNNKIVMLPLLATLSGVAMAEAPNNQLRGGELQSFAEHQYGKVEVRMYTQHVVGTTSTFFWWRNGGHECGTQWNEIDIETIPVSERYQSNPIWQTSDGDCDTKRDESLHGSVDLYDRWVDYTLEWTPDYIAWYHDGQLDRRISRDNHSSVQHIYHAMRYCFNLWTQGTANPAWLGNLDFSTLSASPVYQFVDDFKYYAWNGSGFSSLPTTHIDFSSVDDIYNNFNISNWQFGESQGYVTWSQDAVGIVDLGNGNGALWLGLFYAGQERPPAGNEIPASGENEAVNFSLTVEAESAENSSGLVIAGDQLGYISNGSWASYPTVNIPADGLYTVTYQVASAGDGGTIQLERAGGGEIFGQVSVPVTGGWTNWTPVSHQVWLPAGEMNFGLYFADGGFNINSFTISSN